MKKRVFNYSGLFGFIKEKNLKINKNLNENSIAQTDHLSFQKTILEHSVTK